MPLNREMLVLSIVYVTIIIYSRTISNVKSGPKKLLNKDMLMLRLSLDFGIIGEKMQIRTIRRQDNGLKKLLIKEVLTLSFFSVSCMKKAKV